MNPLENPTEHDSSRKWELTVQRSNNSVDVIVTGIIVIDLAVAVAAVCTCIASQFQKCFSA